jgi:hypothetical protein
MLDDSGWNWVGTQAWASPGRLTQRAPDPRQRASGS